MWESAFRNIEEVSIIDSAYAELRIRSDIDALLDWSLFAHELLGGAPIKDQSQVLSTDARPDIKLPPWMVTLAPIEKNRFKGAPEKKLYYLFTTAFLAIASFNRRKTGVIKSLGFDSKALAIFMEDPRKEANAVSKAFRDFRKNET